MKKFLCLVLALMMGACMFVACGESTNDDENTNDVDEIPEGVMSYEEFVNAELDTEVTVITYVQAKQGWWNNKGTDVASFYTQSSDGAYFLYNMPCTEAEYNALVPGTKIKVTGYKAAYKGLVEIIDAKFEILSGSYLSEAYDVTALLDSDSIIDYQNERVSFTHMVVEPSNEDGAAFMYNWNGTGSEGDDIYFNASVGGKTYTFVIESYLCGKDTDVYKAAQNLKVGDVIDMEGFLYWYDGAQPHVTLIKQVEKVLDHAGFEAAELDTEVTVITYVQAKQGWWNNKGTDVASFYTQAPDGAYFLYNMPCTEAEFNALVPGTRIKVTGYKAAYKGLEEIIDATFEILPGNFVAEASDVTELLGNEEIIAHQNEKISFKDLTVVASNDDGAAFLYSWNGTGSEGDDIYFNASIGDATYTFVIESYLCDKTTDVYKAVQALNVGDVIDMEGFLYWYDGAQPHITSVVVK